MLISHIHELRVYPNRTIKNLPTITTSPAIREAWSQKLINWELLKSIYGDVEQEKQFSAESWASKQSSKRAENVKSLTGESAAAAKQLYQAKLLIKIPIYERSSPLLVSSEEEKESLEIRNGRLEVKSSQTD